VRSPIDINRHHYGRRHGKDHGHDHGPKSTFKNRNENDVNLDIRYPFLVDHSSNGQTWLILVVTLPDRHSPWTADTLDKTARLRQGTEDLVDDEFSVN